MKAFKNIFCITFIMSLFFTCYNNLGAMEVPVIKLKKIKHKNHKRREAEFLDALNYSVLKDKNQEADLVKSVISKLEMGESFYSGKVIPKDYKQALNNLVEIIEISKIYPIDLSIVLSAQYLIGLIYLFGDDNVEQDAGNAFKIFNDIVTNCEAKRCNALVYIESNYCIGLLHYCKKDYKKALEYFDIVLDIPNVQTSSPVVYLDIKCILGIMNFFGYGTEINILKSQACFVSIIKTLNAGTIRPSALSIAKAFLKDIYLKGLSCTDTLIAIYSKNIYDAIDTQKFNTIDLIKAHYFFALSYWTGSNNISKDATKALFHFFAIFALGDAEVLAPDIFLDACNYLGDAYFYGNGIKVNYKNAKKFFNRIVDTPNSLSINVVAYMNAKCNLHLLGQDDADILDSLIENQ